MTIGPAKERINRNVELGRAAVMAGDPDFKENLDKATSLVDTLANLRHWARKSGVSWYAAMAQADSHYAVEVSEEAEERRREIREEPH